jgi:hypothetical protein
MKKIKGFENYSIDEKGRVWSHVIQRFIKHQMNRYGYLTVKLSNNGKKMHKSVHRLVAEAYLDNTENKKEVNHIDGIKTNNNLENLEWATRSENAKHSWNNGLQKHSQKRLDAVREKISIIVLDLQTGVYYNSIAEAAKLYKIHPMSLREMLNGKYKNKTTLKIV